MKSSPLQRKSPMPRGKAGLKQGAPLQRRTGLGRGTKELKRGTRLARHTELCSTATKPKRQRDTGPSKKLKDQLKTKRAKGVCERCAGRGRLDVHHRRARKMGGTKRPEINDPSNLLVLCRSCHHAITDSQGNRPTYEFEGLLIREDGRDTTTVKVLLAGGWFLLDNQGAKTPTTAPEFSC